MNHLQTGSAVFFILAGALLPAFGQEAGTAGEPNVRLKEWGKGIGVESLDREGMAVYLWFYEWNMFEARSPGQHTHGADKWPRTLSADGRTATIDADGLRLAVRAVRDGAELTLQVTNRTDYAWPEIAGIIPCFNPGAPPRNAAQFPRAPLNRQFDNTNTWYVGRDGLEKLVGRDIHFNARLREKVDAQAENGQFVFSHKWPTSPDNAHQGLLVRESTDGEWVAGIAWERFLSAQGHNPWACMHLCVNVGPLAPGESRTIRGRIYLFPGTRDECYDRFRKEFAESL